MNPDAQHFIDQLEAGQIDLDDPRLLNAAARWPELGLLVAELQDVQALLEGGQQADAIEVARAAAGRPEDRALVERAMTHPRRPRFPTLGLVAAAALVLVVGGASLWHSYTQPTAYDPGPRLGGQGEFELLDPVGEVETFDAFTWRAPETPGHWYVVTVKDLDTGATLVSEHLTSNIWRTGKLSASKRIEWAVECFRGSSTNVSRSAPSRASRRR